MENNLELQIGYVEMTIRAESQAFSVSWQLQLLPYLLTNTHQEENCPK